MKHWPTLRLVEVLEVSRERIEPTEHPETEFNYIGLETIEGHTGKLLPYQPALGIEIKSTKNVFHRGEILYGKLRPYLNKVHLVDKDGICSTDIYVLKPRQQRIHPSFAAYYLRSPSVVALVSSAMAGANLPRIGQDALLGISVPVPPMMEQERIVELLDEADELRKLRAQADRRTATLISALFHEMFGQRIAGPPVVTSTVGLKAPREWRWVALTDVARLATGHTPSRRHPEWWGGDIPWISLTDIRELDGKIATATGECVNEEGILHSSSVKLPEGTVCFSRTASVGFVTVMGREMATSQDFVNWVCGPELDPIFLMGALMQAREHLRSLASGSTHKTIYFPTVKQFAAIIPPIALQKEFAQRVAEIYELKASQAASRTRLDDLFHSMLHRAFTGEL